MRIAVIGPVGLPPAGGGVTRHSYELARRLGTKGHEVTVFGRSAHVAADTQTEGIRLRRVRVPVVPGWDTLLYGLRSTLAASREDFDLVHYQGVVASTFAPLAERRGKKVALTVHSIDWSHAKWTLGPRTLLARTERAAIGTAGTVIAVSQFLRDDLQRRYPGQDIHYIPNGLTPLPEPDPRTMQDLAQMEPYVLFVGRLVPEKGLHTLIEAHRGLDSPSPALLIAGSGPRGNKYLHRLKAAAGPNVWFLGHQPPDRLAACFSRASLFVAPSSREGFNLTVLEAASLGAPILASDIPPHREILGPGGAFFRPGQADSLRREMAALLTDPSFLRTQARRSLEAAQSPEYDWDRVATRTAKLLEKAIAQPS